MYIIHFKWKDLLRSLAPTTVGSVTVIIPTECQTSIPHSITITPVFNTPDTEIGQTYLFVFFSRLPPRVRMTYACLINGNVETTCTLTTSEDLIVSDDYLLSYVHSENKNKMLTFIPVKMTIELFPLSSEPQQTTQTITSFDTPLIVKVSNDYSTGYCLPL